MHRHSPRDGRGKGDGVIRWLRSLFAWRTAFKAGCYVYEENAITGRRRHVRVIHGGYSPIDQHWLDGGSRGWLPPPPRGGSGTGSAI